MTRGVIRSGVRGLAWLVLCTIVVVTISPAGDRPHIAFAGVRSEHAFAFVTLGCLFGAGYRRHWVEALWFVVLLALGLELAQLLTPDRHARMLDAEVKAFAGALGVLVGSVFARVAPAN